MITVTPIFLLAVILMLVTSNSLQTLVGLAILLYVSYLLKWGKYTWADYLFYGKELSQHFRPWTPAGEHIRFPINFLYGVIRFSLVIAAGILGVMGGSFLHSFFK